MSWVLIMVALMVTVYHCFLRFMVGGFLVFIGFRFSVVVYLLSSIYRSSNSSTQALTISR